MPVVKNGNLRVNVEFSADTFEDLTLLVFAERRGCIAFNHKKAIRTTYAL